MILESVEQALTWARTSKHLRHNSHMRQDLIKGKNRPCTYQDVFIVFQRAWEQKKISDFQYRLFKFAATTGDVPRDKKISEQWEKMIETIKPMMIEKGILGKCIDKEYA